MALITDIGEVLRNQPQNLGEYLRHIRSDRVTPAERRFVLRDRVLMGRIRQAVQLQGALAVSVALMEGSFEWRAPGQNGFYTQLVQRFMMGNNQRGMGFFMTQGPTHQTLNCWESVLLGLFAIGYVTDLQVYNHIYRVLETQAGLPNPQTWNALGYSTVQEYDRNMHVAPGMLMYYVPAANGRLTQSYPNHITVSIGGDEAVSLWTQPHGRTYAQRVNTVTAFPNSRVFLSDPARVFH